MYPLPPVTQRTKVQSEMKGEINTPKSIRINIQRPPCHLKSLSRKVEGLERKEEKAVTRNYPSNHQLELQGLHQVLFIVLQAVTRIMEFLNNPQSKSLFFNLLAIISALLMVASKELEVHQLIQVISTLKTQIPPKTP
jgi:hypothetical protein